MAWTNVDKPAVPQLVNAAYMNALKDNINYLHLPNFATYHHPGTGANYTNTGTLGEDVDATNFNLSITTYGGLIAACFYGQLQVSAGTVRVGIVKLDTVSYIGRNMFFSYDAESDQTVTPGDNVGFIKFFRNVPAGTHTFRLVWGISGGTATLHIAYKPRMSVWEI